MTRPFLRCGVLLALFAMPLIAGAQRVTGTVRDSASKGVIPGAVVSVLDSANHTLARGLSDAAGRYTLEISAAARTLRVVRIGFRPVAHALQGTTTRSPLDITMQHLATLLSSVEVSDDKVCSTDPRRVAALSLWEQARAGLLAAIVAREANPADAVIINYERQLEATRQRVIMQTARKSSGQTTRPFSAAASPATFAARGYAQTFGGVTQFYAPDADVLLDESFARAHCFTVASADSAHAGAVGLAFEPALKRQDFVDVRGVLWIESGVPALRSIEYRYTGGDAALTHRDAFGVIHFRTMSNGVAFIDEWMSHIPVLTPGAGMPVLDPSTGRTTNRVALKAEQFSETGGITLSAEWPDGVKWKAPLEPLTGRVTEEKSTRPLPGVLIAIPATGDSVLTDSLGRYAIFPLFPGKYLLTFSDTVLGAFVPSREAEREVTIRRGGANVENGDFPARLSTLRRMCEDTLISDRQAILLGRLDNTDDRGRLPPGLSITANFINPTSLTINNGRLLGNVENQGIAVDDKGRFSACNVPRELAIHLTLMRGQHPVADTALTIARTTDIERFLWQVSAKGLVPSEATKPAQFGGSVMTASGPLAGAEVWVPMIDRRVMTDAAGRFSFSDLPAGFTVVQVRKIGHAVQRDTITLSAGASARRSYTLIAQTAMLDTVRTRANANAISPSLRGFEERRRRAEAGYFISDSTLRAEDGKALASIIASRMAGLALTPGRMGASFLRSSRIPCKGTFMGSCTPCYVTTYLDGIMIYALTMGGNPPPPPPDANQIKVNELSGVEFYPTSATAPPEYNATGSGCGVLLLWTRER